MCALHAAIVCLVCNAVNLSQAADRNERQEFHYPMVKAESDAIMQVGAVQDPASGLAFLPLHSKL